MKYILFKDRDGGYMAVTFPDFVVHSDMAKACHRLENRPEPISAGFTGQVDGVMVAHGRSESLMLESRPLDGFYLTLGDVVQFRDISTAMAQALWADYQRKASQHGKNQN